MQHHLGNTSLVQKNPNTLHCCTGAFGQDAKGLEHGSLVYPVRCKQRMMERWLSGRVHISASVNLHEMMEEMHFDQHQSQPMI